MEKKNMTNFQVYKKTLSFSFVGFLVDLLVLLLIAGLATAGFFLLKDKGDGMGILGLVIGAFVGGVLSVLISIFISNRIKAAQIAMMTKGVVDNELPENTYKAGFQELKGRFGKITLFFLITNAIKSVFREIGKGINKIGTAVGGDVGGAVTSGINSAIQTVIAYLCDCCLGWVLYRKDINGFKAGCEGAVIFFKHGKTLVRNVGRIFGMGFLSLLIVGGIFFGITYGLSVGLFQGQWAALANEIHEIAIKEAWESNFFIDAIQQPQTLIIVASIIIGIIFWGIIHSLLIRPFILVGVLRNYMAAGLKDLPKESDIKELENKFPKMKKLSSRA